MILFLFFSKLFAKGRGDNRDVIWFTKHKKKITWCFIFMLYIYILAVAVGEPNLTFREILKLITPDNYCKTRSAAQKYNPQVNVNVESTCVDGGSFRNLNFSREQILWLKKPI